MVHQIMLRFVWPLHLGHNIFTHLKAFDIQVKRQEQTLRCKGGTVLFGLCLPLPCLLTTFSSPSFSFSFCLSYSLGSLISGF